MSGKFTRSWCEAGAQTPPLLRASSPLKPKNQPRTNIENWYSERGHFRMEAKAEETLKPSEAGLREGTPTDIPTVDQPHLPRSLEGKCANGGLYPSDCAIARKFSRIS